MLCNNGFADKNNCRRHIHKQHPDVPIKFIYICIYETEAGEVHNTTVEEGMPWTAGRNTSPSKYALPAGLSGHRTASSYITSPPVVKIKSESQEEEEDQNQPLDFSVKAADKKPLNQRTMKDEQPIDLSGGTKPILQPNYHGLLTPGFLGQASLNRLSGGHIIEKPMGDGQLSGQSANALLTHQLLLHNKLLENNRLQQKQQHSSGVVHGTSHVISSGSKSILPQVSNYDLLSSSAVTADYLSSGDGLTDGLTEDGLTGRLSGALYSGSMLSAMNPALQASLSAPPYLSMHMLESYYEGLGPLGLDLVGRCIVD